MKEGGESRENGEIEQSTTEHGSSIVKKGILLKKGMGNIFRPWSLRTMVVDIHNKLSYFDRDTLKGIKRSISQIAIPIIGNNL